MTSDFIQKVHTKDCSIVLERLDKKSLNKLLKKHELIIARNPFVDQFEWKKAEKIRNRKLEKSTFEKPIKKRKRKVKPLVYSDEESTVEDENIVVREESSSELGNVSKSTDTKDAKINSMTGQISSEKTKEDKIGLSDTQKESVNEKSADMEVQSEIEILKEFLKSTKGQTLVCTESQKNFVEDEPREEHEDDRETVIFEEELHKDTDLEDICEEKEIISKQFKNREITNRKKQRLVKFKRKSIAGRNLTKYRRPKSKCSDGAGNGEELSNKSTDLNNEDCLKEMCGLIKRLHELYRIILQLQKELPNDTELAIHFSRVIHAQQENFHREIRQSQKTIIKCYEKMLTLYKNTTKVALEISKQTFLSVDDIVNIISRCILVEGHSESEKSTIKRTNKTQLNSSTPKYVFSNPSSSSSGVFVHRPNDAYHEPPSRNRTTHIAVKNPSASRCQFGHLELSGRRSELIHPLDPTVPQKLTMRNHRLQAGPALGPQVEDVQTNSQTQSEGRRRVYVCAMNDCRNVGAKVCKRCLSVIYCSDVCQLKHWTLKHRVECYQLKELRG